LLQSMKHPYLTRQLIAYIGNKRALLGFLRLVFKDLAARHTIRVFLDPFAGSGAVSRLARLMGYKVLANDWEFYSKVLNTCHLAVEERDAASLFVKRGGLERTIDLLNSLHDPGDGKTYIARHFAPRSTAGADYRTERLFYTRENALRIDAVRQKIEEWYPGFDLEHRSYTEKMVLLSMLIYQSATHTNTSGVFKACHKGFGGHGRDALKRIMGEIRLERPVLIDGRERAEVYSIDARDFVSGRSGDLCYLDPPYTTHQYGSNYHMLNTIALWDRPPVDQSLDSGGRLKEKAGIRKDWIRTRSHYCYRNSALPAFRELLESIDCRFIAVSYNTEGIIPFEELYKSLADRGRVDLYTSDYVKYRGGKQSLRRENYNLEFLLVVERGAHNGRTERRRIERLLLQRRLRILYKQSFYPDRIRHRFERRDSSLLYRCYCIPMPFLYRFDLEVESAASNAQIEELTASADIGLLRELHDRLAACLCTDKKEEIEILLGIIRSAEDSRLRHHLIKRALWLLRKFAFRKYRTLFRETLARMRSFLREQAMACEDYTLELNRIERRATKRFTG
jgi:adenine-specific DNA-methyltransferase